MPFWSKTRNAVAGDDTDIGDGAGGEEKRVRDWLTER